MALYACPKTFGKGQIGDSSVRSVGPCQYNADKTTENTSMVSDEASQVLSCTEVADV